MNKQLRLTCVFPVKAKVLYAAFLDSKIHGAMTGGKAEIDPKVGGHFTAWDGYIEGTILELVSGKRIVQAWRTSEFPPASKDSRLEMRFGGRGEKTTLTLIHTQIPKGQMEMYEQGWQDHYFTPMMEFFKRQKQKS